MPSKTVQVGVRLTEEDAEFISGLSLDGAKTVSDKIRAIITESRRRHEGLGNYRSALGVLAELFAPITDEIRAQELDSRTHSELITRTLEWLPETSAFLMSASSREQGSKETLELLEQGVADRLVRMMQSVLQLAVTRNCPCYSPHLLDSRIDPVLDLAKIIEAKQSST